MKINEVESLVGITKKNIRFYEEKVCFLPVATAKTAIGSMGWKMWKHSGGGCLYLTGAADFCRNQRIAGPMAAYQGNCERRDG